jgi:hypothetical protein
MDAAFRDHQFQIAHLDAVAELRAIETDASFTANQAQTNAQHDYRIADIDAVIDALTTVRDHFNSTATHQARNYAVAMRDTRVAEINLARSTALQAQEHQKTLALANIENEQSEALTEANASYDARIAAAQDAYDHALLTETIAAAILPSIASYPAVSLGISATAVPFFVQPLTLVDTLTRELSFGGDGEIAIIHEPGSGAMTVGDVAEEMFQGTGLASVVDMGRLVIHTQVSFHAGLLRMLPYGDELVDCAGQVWSLTRHYASTNAVAVREHFVGLANTVRHWGASGGWFQYTVGLTVGSWIESAGGLFSATLVDPMSTVEGIGTTVSQYYERGGVIGVAAGMTGAIGFYESYSGIDYLSGEMLNGDERFDRV